MAARPRRTLVPEFDASRAVMLILRGYDAFLERCQAEVPGDAKAFATQHAAGRAALTHAEHVLKIAALVGAVEPGTDLSGLVAEARAQLDEDTTAEEGEGDDEATGGDG
jgi:hypothetical protein